MALSIFHHPVTSNLTVIAGYESGHTSISQLTASKSWQSLYLSQAHAQPILSLDVAPTLDFHITSSADAIVAKHPIPIVPEHVVMSVESMPLKTLQTKHAGQQGLRMRSDGKIFATAGWDARVRVYSAKGMKELAVLKWHKEGCYAVAFAEVITEESERGDGRNENSSAVVKKEVTMTVKEERLWKAKTSHWLAVGSKDGKVSLWDIY